MSTVGLRKEIFAAYLFEKPSFGRFYRSLCRQLTRIWDSKTANHLKSQSNIVCSSLCCLMHQISHQCLGLLHTHFFDLGCFLQLLWRLWAVSSCKTSWQPGFILYFIGCGLLFPYCQPGLCASLLSPSSVRALLVFGIKDSDWW